MLHWRWKPWTRPREPCKHVFTSGRTVQFSTVWKHSVWNNTLERMSYDIASPVTNRGQIPNMLETGARPLTEHMFSVDNFLKFWMNAIHYAVHHWLWISYSVTALQNGPNHTVSLSHCTTVELTDHTGCTVTPVKRSNKFVCLTYPTVYIGPPQSCLQYYPHPPGSVTTVSVLPCSAHTTLLPPSIPIPSIPRFIFKFFLSLIFRIRSPSRTFLVVSFGAISKARTVAKNNRSKKWHMTFLFLLLIGPRFLIFQIMLVQNLFGRHVYKTCTRVRPQHYCHKTSVQPVCTYPEMIANLHTCQ